MLSTPMNSGEAQKEKNEPMEKIVMKAALDMHVHLRQDAMMQNVTPLLSLGGVSTALVMPNLSPPITTVDSALAYKHQLTSLSPSTAFLMTLYMNPSLTPEEMRKAKDAGIVGIKFYPHGVTTNSLSGVADISSLYPIIAEMEKVGLVLNIHGEVPSSPDSNISILNAEQAFLPTLRDLSFKFPNLKIVLEHATTKEAIETVLSLSANVACTITPHHLCLVADDWAGNSFNYCKPVAKTYADQSRLIAAIKSGNEKFFLGSDSAPHLKMLKMGTLSSSSSNKDCCSSGNNSISSAPAGIFTTPILMPLLVHIFERESCLDRLEDFAVNNAAKFYGLSLSDKTITLTKGSFTVPIEYFDGPENAVVPFMAGKDLGWTIYN